MNNAGLLPTADTMQRCRYCGRVLPEGACFARLWRRNDCMEFCRPRCVELFLEAEDQEAAGFNGREEETEQPALPLF